MLDAASLRQLDQFVTEAILSPKPQTIGDEIHDPYRSPVKEYTFKTNASVESQIDRVEMHFCTTYEPPEFDRLYLSTLNSHVLRSKKIPSKTGAQLAIQLASLVYFGKHYPSWETLTTMLFHQGRLDWMQVVSAPMLAFCKAAIDNSVSPNECLKLLREATTYHSSTMSRISRGRGFAAHLEAMKEAMGEDEQLPDFFRDPTWEMMGVTRTRKIKTDASEGLNAPEAGFFMPDPESVLVHYEVQDEGILFFVQSTQGRVESFCAALKRSTEKVRYLLDL